MHHKRHVFLVLGGENSFVVVVVLTRSRPNGAFLCRIWVFLRIRDGKCLPLFTILYPWSVLILFCTVISFRFHFTCPWYVTDEDKRQCAREVEDNPRPYPFFPGICEVDLRFHSIPRYGSLLAANCFWIGGKNLEFIGRTWAGEFFFFFWELAFSWISFWHWHLGQPHFQRQNWNFNRKCNEVQKMYCRRYKV